MAGATARAGAVGTMAACLLVLVAGPAQAGHPNWISEDGEAPDSSTDYFEVSESKGSITLRFTAQLDPTHVAYWRTTPLTAGEDEDFRPSSGQWPGPAAEGQQQPSATIALLPDEDGEGTERFGVLLWLDGYAEPGTPEPQDGASCRAHGFCDYAVVDIKDDDPVPSVEGSDDRFAAGVPRPVAAEPRREAGSADGDRTAAPAAVTPPMTPPEASGPVGQPSLLPGPGFELVGEGLGAERGTGGAQQGHSNASGEALPWFLLGAVVLGSLAAWAWRRRRTW